MVHAPLTSRQSCLACHRPHTSSSASLLDRPDDNLCFSCHDGTVTKDRSYVFDPNRPEHVRKPGVDGQDCDRCHAQHGQVRLMKPRQESEAIVV